MRLRHCFIAATAALTFFSCASDAGKCPTPSPENAAKIRVKLTAAPEFRSTGSTVLEDEQRVDNFVVFIFKADGSLDATGSAPDGETTIEVEASTAAASVYVLVNTGELGEELMGTIYNLDELLSATGDLLGDDELLTQTGEALWMSGNGGIGEFSDDAIPVATAEVEVYFIASKIRVTVVDNRNHVDDTSINRFAASEISITDNKIVLLFATGRTPYFESSEPMSDKYYHIFLTGDNSYPDPYDEFPVTLTEEMSEDFAPTGVYFYTFANDATVQPTILAIQSTRYVDGEPTTIYYPAHFTLADLGYVILPGREYDITLTLTGDVYNGGAGGTTDPERSIIDAMANVSVRVNNWTPVTIGKEL